MNDLYSDLLALQAEVCESTEGFCACGRHHADQCALCESIKAGEYTPTEMPLSQWLNKLFSETEELLGTVAGPAYRFLSKEEIMSGLGIDYDDVLMMAQIGTRLQLIASNIDSRNPPKLKVVSNG